MLRDKIKMNKGMINQELLQRLDKMDNDGEYDPYKSVARKTIMQDDLFNDEDYGGELDEYYNNAEKTEEKPIREGIGITMIIGIVLIITAVFTYIFAKYML